MNLSVQGLDRIGLTGCQSAPSLGFGSIPPWRMGKVGKGVSTFPRGRCIERNDLGEVILFSAGYPPLVFFLTLESM
jgi:hypothetical protein